MSEGESIGDDQSDHDSHTSLKDESEESDGDIMVKVPKERQTDIGELEEPKEIKLKASSKKLKKITKDGPYGGKNR